MKKNLLGALGEMYAAGYLREKGYKILCANYRTRFGEIDIIAVDKLYICFTEVKTRGKNSIGSPSDAVDKYKQGKIYTTAEQFLAKNPTKLQPRFDVIEVYTDENNKPIKLNHIKNAFNGDDINASF